MLWGRKEKEISRIIETSCLFWLYLKGRCLLTTSFYMEKFDLIISPKAKYPLIIKYLSIRAG